MQPINDNRIISITTLIYAVVVVLCVATHLFFAYVPQFQPTGDELLKNANFDNQFNGWALNGKGIQLANIDSKKTIFLESKSPTQFLSISQHLKESALPERVILSALIKTTGVLEGKKKWNAARLLFVGKNKANKRLRKTPHVVESITGTREWTRYSQSFETKSNALNYDVVAQLGRTSGKMWLSDISLRAAAPNPIHSSIRLSLICLWGVFIVFVVIYLAKTHVNLKFSLSIYLLIPPFTLMTLLAFLPIQFSNTGSSAAHIVSFSLISFFTFLVFDKQSYKLIITLIFIAIITEVLQHFAPTRTPSIGDVIMDCIGIAVGCFIYNLYLYYHRWPYILACVLTGIFSGIFAALLAM